MRKSAIETIEKDGFIVYEATCNVCRKCGENTCGNDTVNFRCFEKQKKKEE
jgi:hypothetical protein